MNKLNIKHPLIRNMLTLIIVLTAFLTTIFFYFIISHEAHTTLEYKIKSYNDLSATSILKTIEHLTRIRVIILSPHSEQSQQRLNTKSYEISVELNNITNAQKTYKDEQFAFLVSRLSQQYDLLAPKLETLYKSESSKAGPAIEALDSIGITLEQLYRLHTQQAILLRKKHTDFFKQFDRWLLGITAVLFLFGALILGKGIRQINSSLTEQERMEEELRDNNLRLENHVKERTHDLEASLSQLKKENAERVRTEQLLRIAKAEADDANKLKSEFLGRMSHELRTPMNAILGFGQILQSENNTSSQQESIDAIMKAGWHLLHLIDDVLDLTVIENKKINIQLEDIMLDELVLESISLMEKQAQKYNIHITNYVLGKNHIVRGDKLRTKEVIVNLLTNAVKYNKKGGSISINLDAHDNMIKLLITDTGPGLTTEQQKTIFEPFNRLEASCTDIEGTGIGLTISKQLIELMHGNIGIESTNDEGCTFWISLPESTPITSKQNETELPVISPISSGNKSVLYIEDNPANLLLVKSIINKNSDLSFLSATNAEQGIELAKSKCPDLIILDLNLPVMDGFEAISRLRNYPETSNIPVIALSAAAMPNDIKRGLLAGFKHYITKPLNINELCSILKEELGTGQLVAKR